MRSAQLSVLELGHPSPLKNDAHDDKIKITKTGVSIVWHRAFKVDCIFLTRLFGRHQQGIIYSLSSLS